MYIPKHFREPDAAAVRNLIREHAFAVLITVGDGAPQASHLPFVLDESEGEHGALFSHVARANDHWKHGNGEALVVFSGPDHYISPRWYQEDGTVPTWNYVAVHVRGALEWRDDLATKQRVLAAMVERFESGVPAPPAPWAVDFDARYIQAEMKQIVPLRVAVRTIEAKWKLNQHHPRERQVRTAQALRSLPGENAQAVAALMEASILRQDSAGRGAR